MKKTVQQVAMSNINKTFADEFESHQNVDFQDQIDIIFRQLARTSERLTQSPPAFGDVIPFKEYRTMKDDGATIGEIACRTLEIYMGQL